MLKKRFIVMLLVLAMICTSLPFNGSFVSAKTKANASNKVKTLVKVPMMSQTKVTVGEGTTTKLSVENFKGKVKWSSSNKKCVKVSSAGKVTGNKLGRATITAKFSYKKKKKKLKCLVYVKAPCITTSKVKLNVGTSKSLSVMNFKGKVSWSTSNKSVANVNKNGVVKGIKVGKTTISAKIKFHKKQKTYKWAVTVEAAPVQPAPKPQPEQPTPSMEQHQITGTVTVNGIKVKSGALRFVNSQTKSEYSASINSYGNYIGRVPCGVYFVYYSGVKYGSDITVKDVLTAEYNFDFKATGFQTTMKSQDGNLLANEVFKFKNKETNEVASFTSNENGVINENLISGTYDIYYMGIIVTTFSLGSSDVTEALKINKIRTITGQIKAGETIVPNHKIKFQNSANWGKYVTTDSNGNYSIILAEAEYKLCDENMSFKHMTVNQNTTQYNIVTSAIKGRFCTADGQKGQSFFKFQCSDLLSQEFSSYTTDEDGNFFILVAPNEHRIQYVDEIVSTPSYGIADIGNQNLELTRVNGKVKNDGKVSGCCTLLFDSYIYENFETTKTDSEGNYDVLLKPGKYEVYVKGDEKNYLGTITVGEDGTVTGNQNFNVTTYEVAGHFLKNGKPMYDYFFHVYGENKNVFWANCDSLGNYTLNLVPGKYHVKDDLLSENAYFTVNQDGSVTGNTNFDAKATTVKGKVYNRGEIVRYSGVKFFKDNYEIYADTNEAGEYEVDLCPGTYKVYSQEYSRIIGEITVDEDGIIHGDTNFNSDYYMVSGCIDTTGETIYEHFKLVNVEDSNEVISIGPEFDFQVGLKNGTYDIYDYAGRKLANEQICVNNKNISNLKITYTTPDPVYSIEGTLEECPTNGYLYVYLFDKDNNYMEKYWVEGDHKFKFSYLPNGKYILKLTWADENAGGVMDYSVIATKEITINGGDQNDIKIKPE